MTSLLHIRVVALAGIMIIAACSRSNDAELAKLRAEAARADAAKALADLDAARTELAKLRAAKSEPARPLAQPDPDRRAADIENKTDPGEVATPQVLDSYHANYVFYERLPDGKQKNVTQDIRYGSRLKLRRGERYTLSFSYARHASTWQRRALGQIFGHPDSQLLSKYPIRPAELEFKGRDGITGSMSAKDTNPTLASIFLLDIAISKDCKVGDDSLSITVPRGPSLGIFGDGTYMDVLIGITIE